MCYFLCIQDTLEKQNGQNKIQKCMEKSLIIYLYNDSRKQMSHIECVTKLSIWSILNS